jgi:hypothetical protein
MLLSLYSSAFCLSLAQNLWPIAGDDIGGGEGRQLARIPHALAIRMTGLAAKARRMSSIVATGCRAAALRTTWIHGLCTRAARAPVLIVQFRPLAFCAEAAFISLMNRGPREPSLSLSNPMRAWRTPIF